MGFAYESLVSRLHRIAALQEAAGVLQWDQETMMPPGGVEARAFQLSALSAIAHESFIDEATGRLLNSAEREESDEKHLALLRETRWAYERATRVPSSLVEALSKATSRALPIWAKARKDSSFQTFRPILEEIVDLRRQYAAAIDHDAPPYEVLFGDYEPWIPLDETRRNLRALSQGLRPILEKAKQAPAAESPFEGEWPVEAQVAFNRTVLESLGYDFERGRLDVSEHPFSTGNVHDARITTRYDPHDPLSGISSTIHEFGHALYTLGLPKEDFGTPLGEARDLVVHESQSRLWENHVGRSHAFWTHLLPRMAEAFPGRLDGVTPEAAWRAANRVEPSLIRVEADELTYHMHIALRFEIEESIIGGDLEVKEVPQAWNDLMEKHLGIRPPNDAQGCLQDVHWSHGSFGYFPTYSLGSMLAAQLFETFEKETGPADERIRRGEFTPIRTWLADKVHRHGKHHTTSALIEQATGRALSPDAWLAYADAKFGKLASA